MKKINKISGGKNMGYCIEMRHIDIFSFEIRLPQSHWL